MRYSVVCCPTHDRPLFKRQNGRTMIDRDRPTIRRLRLKLRVALTKFLKQAGEDLTAQVVRARKDLGKDAADELKRILASLDLSDWEKLLAELEPLLRKLVEEGGAAAFKQLGISDDLERMLSLVNEHGVEYAKAHGGQLIEDLGKATRKMLKADLAKALEDGLSNDELADMLGRNYAFSRERALVIARTETAYADVQGNIEAYRQSGVVSGKQWITGEGCCDLCDELDGTVVGLDEQFDSDGESVDGPPLHPNCRCDVLPVLTEDENP